MLAKKARPAQGGAASGGSSGAAPGGPSGEGGRPLFPRETEAPPVLPVPGCKGGVAESLIWTTPSPGGVCSGGEGLPDTHPHPPHLTGVENRCPLNRSGTSCPPPAPSGPPPRRGQLMPAWGISAVSPARRPSHTQRGGAWALPEGCTIVSRVNAKADQNPEGAAHSEAAVLCL